jgi:hypothetical protein
MQYPFNNTPAFKTNIHSDITDVKKKLNKTINNLPDSFTFDELIV